MKKLLFLLATMLIAFGLSFAQTSNTGSPNANSASTSQSTSVDQNSPASQAKPSVNAADQNASGTAENSNQASQAGSASSGRLPQTGSELPLLFSLGMGTIGVGLWNRFRK